MNSDTGADNITSLPYLLLFLFVVYKSFGCNLPRIKIHALESYNSVVFSIFMELCTVTTNLGGWRREAANPPESPGTFTIPEDEGRCWESQREGTCQLSPPPPPGPGDASVCLCKDRLSCDPDKPEIHNMTVCTTGWPNEGDAGASERWLTPRDETLASEGFKELLLVNDEVGGWGEGSTEAVSGFPGGSDGKESACNAGDLGSTPGSGSSPGEGHDNPLQYSCLEGSMDRGAWWARVYAVAKSWTWLKRLSLSLGGCARLTRADWAFSSLVTDTSFWKRTILDSQICAQRHLCIPRIYQGLGGGSGGRRMLNSAFSVATTCPLQKRPNWVKSLHALLYPVLNSFDRVLQQKQGSQPHWAQAGQKHTNDT